MKALKLLIRQFLWRIDDHVELKGMFTFGIYTIRYWFDEHNAEIEVYNPIRDTYLDRVADCLKQAVYNR